MSELTDVRYRGLLFADPALEREFKAYWQRLNLPVLRVALLLAAALSAGFHWLDRAFLAPPELATMTVFRFACMVPAALVMLGLTYVDRAVPYLNVVLWPAFLVSAMVFGGVAIAGGPALANYLLSSIVQMLLFAMILLRMHFFSSATLAASMIGIFVLAILNMSLPPLQAANLLASIAAIGGILAIAAYSRETTFRKLFIAQRSLDIAEEQKRRAERERLAWLEHFAGFLRHEMTSQIVGATSSLDLLEDTGDGHDTSVYVDRARTSIDRLTALLDSASEATTLEAALDAREEQPVDIVELVRAQAREYARRFPENSLSVRCAGPAFVRGDSLRLLQLTDNLLSNAFEHAKPGSEIELDCFAEGSAVTLSVSNAGAALPPDREAIFEPWVSLNGKRRPDGANGQGIGLYVARKIAEHHGGRLVAKDREEGTGATFLLELPVAEAPSQTIQSTTARG